jgi:hypothetical protein
LDKSVLAEKNAGKANTVAGDALIGSKTANDAAVKARDKVEAVGKRAEALGQSLGMAQYFLSSPELRDPEKLRKELLPFKGKSALFKSYKNDGDGYFLCEALLSIAGSAGMLPIDQCGEVKANPLVFNDGVPTFINSVAVAAPDDDTMLAQSKIMGGATFLRSTAGGFGKAPHSASIVFFVGRKPHVIVSTTPAKINPRKSSPHRTKP